MRKRANALENEIQKLFEVIYNDRYLFKLEDLIDYNMKIELIADKTATVRLKITKQDKKNMVFGKGRLCGTIEDLSYASFEAYVLELLEFSVIKYEANFDDSCKSKVFPALMTDPKLY